MLRVWLLLTASVLLVGCEPQGGQQADIVVTPGQSIQAAVDAAEAGDVILIQPGTYRPSASAEAMVVIDDDVGNITLRGGGDAPDDVVLDGNDQVLHVIFVGEGVGRSTVIENLTVTGGNGYPDTVLPADYTPVLRPELDLGQDFYYDGAGLMLFLSAPTVRNCRIVENRAGRCGGGISAYCPDGGTFPNPGPMITGNEILDNAVDEVFAGTGGAVDVYFGARATIVNNLMVGNYAWGSAIAVLDNASATIDSNTLVGNRRSAIATTAPSTATVTNSIIAGTLDGAALDVSGTLTCSNCCFFDNAEPWDPPAGQGHVTTDPLFVTGPRGGYYLSQTAAGQTSNSPCVNAGSAAAAGSNVSGRTTRTDSAVDGGTVDIGYHYQP